MILVESAIKYPVKVAVGAILVLLFGVLALARIPVQLTPTIDEPQIGVTTFWPGASPQEVEREIVEEQEEQLKGLEGLVKMESSSADSFGNLVLTFQTGTDVDTALLKVSNRLQQVPSYPVDADKPVIQVGDPNANAAAWFVLLPSEEPADGGEPVDVTRQYTFFDNFIKPEFERVPGVGSVNFFGGLEREMQVIVDPARLAARRITLTELMAALERENRNFSAGDFDEGTRRYVVRTVGEYQSAAEIAELVVALRNGQPVYVRDVARVELGYAKPFAKIFYMGEPTIAFNVIRAPGANLLDMMEDLQTTLAELNRELLAPRGLRVLQATDSTEYIDSAIELVQQSLIIGGLLAITILLLFLRSRSSTLVVAAAIPISVVGAFLMMTWFGRTLNVISLAGMAFAVGMVVDNSIVVLENTYRHRQMGKSRARAAFDGAREVWGAVLASTLTTIAVFLPVLFVQEEAGQLFRDIALAISCSVGLSLLVSITVIPSLAAKIIGGAGAGRGGFQELWGLMSLARRFNAWATESVYWICGSTARRLVVVVGFTAASLLLSWALSPKAEYLPTGNQNFLFGVIQPPPGQSLEENAATQSYYVEGLSRLWETPAAESEALPGGGIRDYFYGTVAGSIFMGIRARDPNRVRELLPEFQRVNAQIPGSIAFVFQSSIFSRSFGAERTIDIELTGPDLERLVGLGGQVFGAVLANERLAGSQARPIPSLDLSNPELQVVTDRRRAADLGVTNRELGLMVNALVDGVRASDYQLDGQEIDLVVVSEGGYEHRTQEIEQLPIATPTGQMVTVGSVARVELASGPTQIDHRERQRAITIAVTPPEQLPLQLAMETIESEILEPLERQGQLGGLYRARLTGTADKLTQTASALSLNFLLAVVITYLLMAALFESFLYPFVILFSVPLAALGGFLGLGVVNLFTYQALDVLTMLGFIILVGTVVNNAILIVHQSLNHMRDEEMAPREAIRASVSTRIRPIFMSVSTSVCGMLPLVLFPGAGSELYRGLGSVVVGGLLVSTLFTLFLVPAMFSLALDARSWIGHHFKRFSGLADEPA